MRWASTIICLLLAGVPIVWFCYERWIFGQTVEDFPKRAAEVAFVIDDIEAYHRKYGVWPRRLEELHPAYPVETFPSGWRYSNHDNEPVLMLFGSYHLVLTYRFPTEPGDTLAGWRCVQEGNIVPVPSDVHR